MREDVVLVSTNIIVIERNMCKDFLEINCKLTNMEVKFLTGTGRYKRTCPELVRSVEELMEHC